MRRMILLLSAAALAAFGQKYDGPRPAKADLPYLKHASNLLPTEAVLAREEKKKSDTIYTVEGANSSVRTPLAAPIFLFLADKLAPDALGLYRFESKEGRRRIVFGSKPPEPIRLDVKRLEGNLYRIEVGESLEPGEYALSPEGSNQVFCFQVF